MQKGFTIVELLIVVVVIAILASITVVAYSGIQQRTVNTSRIAAARNALTLIQMYKTENGTFPVVPPTAGGNNAYRGACIGTGWPTMQGRGVCWDYFLDGQTMGSSSFTEESSVNDALRTVGSVPSYPKQNAVTITRENNGKKVVVNGLALVHQPGAGEAFEPGYTLVYILNGSADSVECGVSGAVRSGFPSPDYAGLTRCFVYLGQ